MTLDPVFLLTGDKEKKRKKGNRKVITKATPKSRQLEGKVANMRPKAKRLEGKTANWESRLQTDI